MDASFENIGKMLEKKFVKCFEISPERIGVCDELYLVLDWHDALPQYLIQLFTVATYLALYPLTEP